MQKTLPTLQRKRIPVYLLTGYLGSGKTTLLARWLKDGALGRPALIINEVGEAGLDHHVLTGISESAALIANSCICCSGMPGLEQALADLFRARLERRTESFDSVIIETTGLADPLPILTLFESAQLLQERYHLTGVITAISATIGLQLLDSYREVSSQVQAADLVVITKTDLVSLPDVTALETAIATISTGAVIANSSQASLGAAEVLERLAAHRMEMPPGENKTAVADPKDPGHDVEVYRNHHHHGADVLFLPLTRCLKRQALRTLLDHWILQHKPSLLRIKGMVRTEGGALTIVQWSLGDADLSMAPFGPAPAAGPVLQLGLTLIVKDVFKSGAELKLLRTFQLAE